MENEPGEVFFDAGNLALDLLNTRRDGAGAASDQLGDPDGLLSWLRAAGLTAEDSRTEALRSPPVARILLTEARELREDVSRAVRALVRGEPIPTHVAYGINRVLDTGRVTASLRLDTEGARLEETERGDAPLAVLVPVARAAAELVVRADPGRVRRCASRTCRRWFIDTSKGGRRKWCSMATCGNRAKAATHRRRNART